jgi:hypothetical protein
MTEYERLRSLTELDPEDELFQRLLARMLTIKALRWMPVLWRQGQARD